MPTSAEFEIFWPHMRNTRYHVNQNGLDKFCFEDTSGTWYPQQSTLKWFSIPEMNQHENIYGNYIIYNHQTPKISKARRFVVSFCNQKNGTQKKVATWGHHVAAFSAAKVESGSWWPWEAKPVGWKVARISMPGEYLFISNNIYIYTYFMYVIIYCILYVYIYMVSIVYICCNIRLYTHIIYVCKYTDVFFTVSKLSLKIYRSDLGPFAHLPLWSWYCLPCCL